MYHRTVRSTGSKPSITLSVRWGKIHPMDGNLRYPPPPRPHPHTHTHSHNTQDALLMRDKEDAIETAWNKSEWNKKSSNARCIRHTKWSTAKQTMDNGEKFGSERADVWYKHVFATCEQSFNDGQCYIPTDPQPHTHTDPPTTHTLIYITLTHYEGIAITVQRWKDKGDEAGATHIVHLANTSTAPLCKWTPIPCPFIASGAGESLNQVMKCSPKTGGRRLKLTYLQQVHNSEPLLSQSGPPPSHPHPNHTPT